MAECGKTFSVKKRGLAAIDGKLNQEKALKVHQAERLETIRKIYEQQKYMYDNYTHSVENRIVSVSQPFVRPIVRGKAGKPVEFGMKLEEAAAHKGFRASMIVALATPPQW